MIVLATGAHPRTVPGQAGVAGVHVLRTLDDTLALRAELPGARHLVVVGDGVLGAEVAATARGLGVQVTLAGPQPAPMARTLGPDAAGLLAREHGRNGVRLRPGVSAVALTADAGRVSGVRLADGEVLAADLVVVALGARPATGTRPWRTSGRTSSPPGSRCSACPATVR